MRIIKYLYLALLLVLAIHSTKVSSQEFSDEQIAASKQFWTLYLKEICITRMENQSPSQRTATQELGIRVVTLCNCLPQEFISMTLGHHLRQWSGFDRETGKSGYQEKYSLEYQKRVSMAWGECVEKQLKK